MKDEMEPPAFDLRVRTKEFALRIVRMFVALPKTEVARVLGKQALRSGTSIGANFREAHRAHSKAEFVAKVGDCLKELDETSYWLELLLESNIVPGHQTFRPPRRMPTTSCHSDNHLKKVESLRVNHSLSCPSFIPHNSSFIIAAPAPGGAARVGKSDNAPSINR